MLYNCLLVNINSKEEFRETKEYVIEHNYINKISIDRVLMQFGPWQYCIENDESLRSSDNLAAKGFKGSGKVTVEKQKIEETLVKADYDGWIVGSYELLSRDHSRLTRSEMITSEIFDKISRIHIHETKLRLPDHLRSKSVNIEHASPFLMSLLNGELPSWLCLEYVDVFLAHKHLKDSKLMIDVITAKKKAPRRLKYLVVRH